MLPKDTNRRVTPPTPMGWTVKGNTLLFCIIY
jgi:hypothetical protein